MPLESGYCCRHGVVCAIISVRCFHSLTSLLSLLLTYQVKPKLVVTHIKHQPFLRGQYSVITFVHCNGKLICYKQPSALEGHFTPTPPPHDWLLKTSMVVFFITSEKVEDIQVEFEHHSPSPLHKLFGTIFEIRVFRWSYGKWRKRLPEWSENYKLVPAASLFCELFSWLRR